MVAINPMLKSRELTTLLTDSGARVLVTLESLWGEVTKGVVPGADMETVVTTSELDFVDDGEVPALLGDSKRERDPETIDLVELIEAHRGEKLAEPRLSAGDVAFLTYTSGTTGPPKGAMNTHGNLTFNSQALPRLDRAHRGRRGLRSGPLFHITGLVGHIGVFLLTGMSLVLSYRFDPDVALERIERHRVTFPVGSITVFIAMMNAPTASQRDVSSFKKIVSGGAPIAPPTVEAFEHQFGADIHNIYGLTETTSPSHCVPFGVRAPVTRLRARCRSACRSLTRWCASSARTTRSCHAARSAYKYPRQLEFIDELPKTVSGKLLRRELRDQEVAKAATP
jgi:long-chain acyl-CoA synthetase